MTRVTTFLALVLLALTASIVRCEDLVAETDELTKAEPALRGAKPVAIGDVLPLLSLDETTTATASSSQNDTAAEATTAPTEAPTPAPVPERNIHPVFGLLMAAIILCVTNNVNDSDTIAAITSTAGILTSVYALVMNLDLRAAIALSVVTIAGGNMGMFVDNVRESARDVVTRPLIDWDLLLIVQPTLILGVVIGVFVRNHLLPTWFLSTALATMLLVCGSLLLQASHRRHLYQQHAEEGETVSINEENTEKPPHTAPPPSINTAIQAIPLNKIGAVVGVIFLTAVLHAALVIAVPMVLLGYLAFKTYKKTSDSLENPEVPRAPPAEGELKWSKYVVHTMPVFSMFAGLLTGTIGFGSDLIFAPYLIDSGLDRTVAAATGSTIVLLASLMTGMECIVLGTVNFTVVILAFALGFVAREWGHMALERGLSEKFHNPQCLAIAFAACTLLAGVALAIASI